MEQDYAAYLATPRTGLSKQGRRAALTTAAAIGLGAATAVTVTTLPSQEAQVQEYRAQYDRAFESGDVDASNAAYWELHSAQNTLTARRITAASTGGATVLAAGATTWLWTRWAGNRVKSEWDPWS